MCFLANDFYFGKSQQSVDRANFARGSGLLVIPALGVNVTS
jgi:hypothetical protein